MQSKYENSKEDMGKECLSADTYMRDVAKGSGRKKPVGVVFAVPAVSLLPSSA